MRAGLSDQYKHVLSFRRQTYVLPDVDIEGNNLNFVLPDSMLISYEGEEFRIFLSTEDHWCSMCKTSDHNTNKCSMHTTDLEVMPKCDNTQPTAQEFPANSQSDLDNIEISNIDETITDNSQNQPVPKGSKRNLTTPEPPAANTTVKKNRTGSDPVIATVSPTVTSETQPK